MKTNMNNEFKNNKKTSIIECFLMLFNPKCPNCGSRDNKIECYAGNIYSKNQDFQTGRQCNKCINFWYS